MMQGVWMFTMGDREGNWLEALLCGLKEERRVGMYSRGGAAEGMPCYAVQSLNGFNILVHVSSSFHFMAQDASSPPCTTSCKGWERQNWLRVGLK